MSFTICLITPDWEFPGEQAIVNQCLSMGLDKLHLRKPHFGYEENRKYLSGIDACYHRRVILHNNFDLINEYGIGGIHLNSAMRKDIMQVKNLSPLSLSSSFHSWENIVTDGNGFNYAFISPVFDSISKFGYRAAIDLKGTALLKKKIAESGNQPPKLIGLSGVKASNITLLKEHEFDGAALLGSVWKATHPIKSFEMVLKAAATSSVC